MAMQSFLAKAGLRLATLGSAASLAIAAPLSEGSQDPAAHTAASRIGVYFDRTPAAEKIGVVVMGTETLAISATGMSITGTLALSSTLTYSASPWSVLANTADGADTSGFRISAGGAVLDSRGAYIDGYGNEHAATGLLRLSAGDVTGGVIRLYTANTNWITVDRTGLLTSTAGVSCTTLTLAAGTTAAAPLRIPHGVAPTVPVNGDVWTTTLGLYAQINGVTQQQASINVAQTWTQAQTFPNGSVAAPGVRLTTEASGLYYPGTGYLGIAVNGLDSVQFFASASGGGWMRLGQGSSKLAMLYSATTDGAVGFAGSNSAILGGQVRVYGNTHATKANYIEFMQGSTVAAYFNGTGKLITITPTTSTASLNLPHGVAPTVPVNGDVWTTTAGLYAQINGVTVGPFGAGGGGTIGGSIAANQIAVGSGANTISGSSTLTQTVTNGASLLAHAAGTNTGTASFNGFSTSSTFTGGLAAASVNGAYVSLTATPGAAATGDCTATSALMTVTAAVNQNLAGTYVRGAYTGVNANTDSIAGTTAILGVFGHRIDVNVTATNASGTAVVGNCYGLSINTSVNGSGSGSLDLSTFYQLYLGTTSQTGNLVSTTVYGIYQADVTAFNKLSGFTQFGAAAASSTTRVNFPASTTAISSLRIAHGSAPTSPTNGDVWTTTAGVYARINGVTVGPLNKGTITGTVADTQIVFGAGTAAIQSDATYVFSSALKTVALTVTGVSDAAGRTLNTTSLTLATSAGVNSVVSPFIAVKGSSFQSNVVAAGGGYVIGVKGTSGMSSTEAGGGTYIGLNGVVSASGSSTYTHTDLIGVDTSVTAAHTAGTGTNTTGVRSVVSITGVGGITTFATGLSSSLTVADGHTMTAGGIFAGINNVVSVGNSGGNIIYGINTSVTSTGNVTNLYGSNVSVVASSGTVATLYGLYINISGAATVTTKYGIYVNSTAPSYMAGSLHIGVAVTATTTLGLAAGTTGVSSLRIPHGAAPTTPVDGDMWTTTAGLYIRINGTTVGPLT